MPHTGMVLSKNKFSAGLLFLLVNIYYSYLFYHVDCYKLVVLGLGVTLLFLQDDLLPIIFRRESPTIIPWKFFTLLLLPFLGTLPGYLLHAGSVNANFSYEFSILLVMLLWSYLLMRNMKQESDRQRMIVWMALTVIAVSLFAILERYGLHLFDGSTLPALRVKATFGNPDFLAGFLSPLLPVFLALLIPAVLQDKKTFQISGRSHVLLYLLTFILGTLALWFTQTRSAIIATTIGTLLVLIMHFFKSQSRDKKRLAFIFLGIVSLLSITFLMSTNRLFNFTTINESWQGRIINWRATGAAIKDAPWFGYGLGSYYNMFFEYVAPDSRLFWNERSFMHAHSEILEIILNGGLFGFVLYLTLWGYIFGYLFKTLKKNNLTLGIIAGLIAFHAQGIFSIAPRKVVVQLVVYTLVCLGWVIHQTANHPEKEQPRPNRSFQIITPLVVLLGFWIFFFPWAHSQYRFVKLIQEPPSLERVMKLEGLARTTPNVYILDFTAFEQLAFLRFAELRDTLKIIETTLPHFRRTDTLWPALDYLGGDLKAAREKALNNQSRDLYELGTIQLLLRVAVLTGDATLFAQQIKNLLELWMITTKTDNLISPHQIVVLIEDHLGEGLDIQTNSQVTIFKFSQKFVSQLFAYFLPPIRGKALTPEEQAGFIKLTTSTFDQIAYFRLSQHRDSENDIKNEIKRREIGNRLLQLWTSLTVSGHDFIRKGF